MATYSALRTRIADELDRTDLSPAQLSEAILQTIKRYEGQRFHFNVVRSLTFNTVAAQAVYGAAAASWIPNVIRLDKGYVTVGGQFRPLRGYEDPFELELLSDNSASRGDPYAFAYFEQSIRLYPIPDAIYAMRFYGHYRLAALSADGDENAWTTDAEDLIAAGAKRWLCQHVIRDFPNAEAMKQAEDEALARLQTENSSRHASGRLRATQF